LDSIGETGGMTGSFTALLSRVKREWHYRTGGGTRRRAERFLASAIKPRASQQQNNPRSWMES
jgi:hypothetical protein